MLFIMSYLSCHPRCKSSASSVFWLSASTRLCSLNRKSAPYLPFPHLNCSSFLNLLIPSVPSQGISKKKAALYCCQRLRPRIPLLLLGTRSWALGISSRDRAALLGLLAISFLEFWGFPHWRLGFRAAFPYGGLRAWGPPCYCPTAPGWPCSFPRAEPSEAFFQETAATEKGHCCSGGRWLERV